MATHIGVGYSAHADAAEAGREAALQALIPLQGYPSEATIAFFTPELDPEQVLAGVRSATGQTRLVGSCSRGVIVSQGIFDSGVAVLALHSDEIQVIAEIAPHIVTEPAGMGTALSRQVWSQIDGAFQDHNRLMMMLESTSDSTAMIKFIEAVSNEVGVIYPMAGGRTVDVTGRHEHSLFLNGDPYLDAVLATLFLTPGPVGVGVRHGYSPLGHPLIISRVEGNTIHELDGKSAFAVYAAQFPAYPELTQETFASFAIDHPLGLPRVGGEYIIRDPYAVRPDGALLCAGALPQYAVVRIMEGNHESLIASAREAAADALAALAGAQPQLALVFSCVTRLNHLGEAVSEELQAIREVIGLDTPLLGIVTYGEIAAQPGTYPVYHNKVVIVALIGAS